MTSNLTFRQLESFTGCDLIAKRGNSALETWYKVVRDKPISEFGYNDLCKSCRQVVFPDFVIPIAIATLRKEPLAGELYDGELIAAMGHIGREYWVNHPAQAVEIVGIAKSVIPEANDDLRSQLAGLMALACSS
jgi:hypothetical protein